MKGERHRAEKPVCVLRDAPHHVGGSGMNAIIRALALALAVDGLHLEWEEVKE